MKQILCGYGINVGYCLTSEVNFEALFTPIVAINCESINVIIQYSFSNAAKITAVTDNVIYITRDSHHFLSFKTGQFIHTTS